LIEAAGGVRQDGLLRVAYLERRGPTSAMDLREIEGGQLSLDAVGDPALRAAIIEQASFEQGRLSDLNFGSRQYLVREMLQFQRVSLEFGNDPSAIPHVVLRDGDRLVVPRDPEAILVFGQIRSPGYVSYAAGANAQDYIRLAGGLGPAATEVYVREAGSGALRPADNTPLMSGDVVFVDRAVIADTESLQALALQEQQLDFQRAQQRQTSRLQIVQTSLSVLGTAVAVVTAYLLATRD